MTAPLLMVMMLVVVATACAWRRRRRCDELLASACHELRGPLTAARLALHTALRTPIPSRGRIEAIELELRRAALALDDLVAARHGRHAPDRHDRVDVERIAAQEAATWHAIAVAGGGRVELRVGDGPHAVRGDRVRIAQAIGNLLANAIEHGSPRIDVAVARRDGRVSVEVADDGAGLPASVSELARARQRRGERGRGLAIAAQIASRHGGAIRATPAVRGTRVTLELPAAPEHR